MPLPIATARDLGSDDSVMRTYQGTKWIHGCYLKSPVRRHEFCSPWNAARGLPV